MRRLGCLIVSGQAELALANLYSLHWGPEMLPSEPGQELLTWCAEQLATDKLRDRFAPARSGLIIGRGLVLVADCCVAALSQLPASLLPAAASIIAAASRALIEVRAS